MKLVTSLCDLRAPTVDDIESFAKQANNHKIWLNLRDAFPHPYTIADAEQWINSIMEETPRLNFLIDVDGFAVGGISLRKGKDIERLSAEIGYWLGEEYWGRGKAEIRLRLQLTGLLPFFGEAIFSALDLGAPKPAPNIYLRAAEIMGAKPARCAVVEDSVTGVRAGKAAGMQVFGYAALAEPLALRRAGAHIFFRMDELPDLLRDV